MTTFLRYTKVRIFLYSFVALRTGTNLMLTFNPKEIHQSNVTRRLQSENREMLKH